MSVARLEHIPGFNVDRVAAAAGDDPDVLRVPWAEQIDPLDLGHGVANPHEAPDRRRFVER